MNRQKLGCKLQEWHSGMNDPVYAVGSYYYADAVYPKKEIVADAIFNLQKDLNQNLDMKAGKKVSAATAYGRTSDLKKFAGYSDRDILNNIKELTEILAGVKKYYEEDYE
jgi:hypothetical protein